MNRLMARIICLVNPVLDNRIKLQWRLELGISDRKRLTVAVRQGHSQVFHTFQDHMLSGVPAYRKVDNWHRRLHNQAECRNTIKLKRQPMVMEAFVNGLQSYNHPAPSPTPLAFPWKTYLCVCPRNVFPMHAYPGTLSPLWDS